ncbi:MAG TPA: TolC family protein [Haliangiales bacterium]|nr:TolC family protein [Haliangiales bacterium]
MLAAAEEPSLTLKDALGTAIVQNRTVRTASLDLEISEDNVYSQTGADDFLVAANANFTRSVKQVVPGQFVSFPETNTFHTDASLTKPLPFGGRVGLQLSNDYTRAKSIFASSGTEVETTSDYFQPSATLTFFTPLLRGLGEKAARVDRKRAQATRDVNTLDRLDKASAVVRDVVQAYWELAYTIEELEIRKSSLDLAKEQLRITQARLDVGVGAPTDLAAVKQTIATREEDVLLSAQSVAQASLNLRQLSGMDIKPDAILVSTREQLLANPLPVELGGALDKAYAANPQLATIKARGRQAQVEVDVTDNGLLPQLDLNASFGPSAAGPEFGQALSDLATFKNYTAFVGLTFSAPIGNHGPRGAYASALANLHKVRVSEEDVRAQVSVAVARAVDVVKSTQKRLEVDAVGTQLAVVNLDAEKARFEVGRSSNFDVVRRQDELAQSRLRQARASADYLKSVAVLEQLTGEILPRYGIQLKDAAR